ncbi:hypothetical protein Goshw_018458 [Gossypium schwendimanii]|uniref:Uncharacterized protein n=1 Tax=Gossypium schwendimanii TaxID=34291 RepID=A0A7J9LP55_GOSSC|nr:hypothetical protein [Gossypium schwendimanii]
MERVFSLNIVSTVISHSTPTCVSKELAERCSGFVTTIVMQPLIWKQSTLQFFEQWKALIQCWRGYASSGLYCLKRNVENHAESSNNNGQEYFSSWKRHPGVHFLGIASPPLPTSKKGMAEQELAVLFTPWANPRVASSIQGKVKPPPIDTPNIKIKPTRVSTSLYNSPNLSLKVNILTNGPITGFTSLPLLGLPAKDNEIDLILKHFWVPS